MGGRGDAPRHNVPATPGYHSHGAFHKWHNKTCGFGTPSRIRRPSRNTSPSFPRGALK